MATELQPGLRQRKKEYTRETITASALRLFADRGFHATTVADIADEAEVSERTVYTYFPTKEDILFSDQIAVGERLAEAMAARPADVPALDVLRNFIVDNLSQFDEQAQMRERIVNQNELLLAHSRARRAMYGGIVSAAIADELGEKADDLRPQLVTAAVIAAFQAVYEHRHSARSQTASRARAEAVFDEAFAFLRGGLDAIKAYPTPY